MIDSSNGELNKTPENPANIEKQIESRNYITPFEELLLSGSSSAIINGRERMFNTRELGFMMSMPSARKILLSPIFVTEGKTTLEEVLKIREKIEYSPSFLPLFETKALFRNLPPDKDIGLSFRPGKLDENGQLTEFSLYPSNDQRVKLSEIAPENRVLNDDFENVVEFLREENGVLKFRIKSKEEIKDRLFDTDDETPFEHTIAGSSTNVVINGKTIVLNTTALEELYKDKDALKIILTPISLTEGKKSLENIRQSRARGKISSGILSLFEFEPQFAYMKRDVIPTLKLGELDGNGQMETFGVYFTQKGREVDLPEKAPEEIAVREKFKDLISYIKSENGVMWYKINTGKDSSSAE